MTWKCLFDTYQNIYIYFINEKKRTMVEIALYEIIGDGSVKKKISLRRKTENNNKIKNTVQHYNLQ